MTKDRQEIDALVARAQALSHEGLEKEAAALARTVAATYPDDPEACLAAAGFTEDREEARELVRRAADAAPDDPWRLTRCASFMLYLEEFEDAERYLLRAIALAPDDFEYAPEVAHIGGRLAERKGNDEFAEEGLSLAFRAYPEGVAHGRVLAEFLANRGRLNEALEIATTAMKYRPDDASLKELRARLLRDTGHSGRRH